MSTSSWRAAPSLSATAPATPAGANLCSPPRPDPEQFSIDTACFPL